MRILQGSESKDSMKYILEAKKVAQNATCLRSKCGSVIVNPNGEIIGKGFNSPAGNLESQRRCLDDKTDLHSKVVDKTCCVHAEHRAIVDALRKDYDLNESRLYFIRLDENNEEIFSGEPYCTHCSKFALDVGIKEFVLFRKEGICVYDTEEYNLISYRFRG